MHCERHDACSYVSHGIPPPTMFPQWNSGRGTPHIDVICNYDGYRTLIEPVRIQCQYLYPPLGFSVA